MCSNIPASPAYGVDISQLIRYARASSNYSDYEKAMKRFALFDLLKSLYSDTKIYFEIYSVSAETIISDAFSYSENV